MGLNCFHCRPHSALVSASLSGYVNTENSTLRVLFSVFTNQNMQGVGRIWDGYLNGDARWGFEKLLEFSQLAKCLGEATQTWKNICFAAFIKH